MYLDWQTMTDEQIANRAQDDHTHMASRRSYRDQMTQLITKVFYPRRHDILRNQPKDARYGSTLYDDTPARHHRTCSMGLFGYMVSKSSPWVQLTPSRQALSRLDHIKAYLQNVEEQGYFGLNKSNLYEVTLQPTLGMTSFGTSIVIPDEDLKRDRVVFKPIHEGDAFIHRDDDGEIVACSRRPSEMTAIQMVEKFGRHKLPEEVVESVDGKPEKPDERDPYKTFKVLQNSYRNLNAKQGVNHLNLPWIDVFCLQDSAKAGNGKKGKSKLIEMRGRRFGPIDFSMGREYGCDYGQGIAWDALTNALISNQLGEKSITAAAVAAEGRWLVSKSLAGGAVHKNPGGETVINGKDDIVKALENNSNWPLTDAQLMRLVANSEDWWFVKLFNLLLSSDYTNVTAFQISRMMGQLAVMMGAIIESYERALGQMVNAVIGHEMAVGRVDPAPEELLVMGGADLNFIGPLPQLQKMTLQNENIMQGLAVVAEFSRLDPNSLIKVDTMEGVEIAAVAAGWPQRLIRDDKTVGQILQQNQEWNKQNQMMEQFEAVAKSVPNLSKEIEPNSPAAAIAAA